jgi:LysM repeat protein
MPTLNVVTTKPANPNGLVITTDRGSTIRMARTPSTWTFKDHWEWEETERAGTTALTKKKADGGRQLSFSILIARPDPDHHVEDLVRPLTELGAYGLVFRIKGGSAVYQGPCWWYVDSYDMDVQRLTKTNMPSQVLLSFQLKEYTGSTSAFTKPPSPPTAAKPPVKPASPTPAKAPVYRWHTVVRGDWLSTLAQRYLGDMKRWPEIQRLNPFIKNPNYLAVGDRVKIPPR